MILIENSFFGTISDYFSVIQFQNHGNEHDHSLLWIVNALIYGKDTNGTIEAFVDNYIKCNT